MRNPIRITKLPSKTHLVQTQFSSQKGGQRINNNENSIHELGLAPPISLKVGELWKGQDERTDIDKENDLDVNKNKTEIYIFVLHTHVSFLRISTRWSTS